MTGLPHASARRPDIPERLFQQLLETASATVRAKLETERPAAKHDIRRVVGDVTGRIRAEATTQTPEYAAARVLVTSLNRAGQLNAAKLEAFAKAGRFEEIVSALSLMSDMPIDFVERAINDADAESLLVLCKAAGFPGRQPETFLR